CALLLDTFGNIVATYPITGVGTLKALTLDPLVTDCTIVDCTSLQPPTVNNFWLGDSATDTFYKLDFATGAPLTFHAGSCTGCGTVNSVQSLAIYGGEGANQPDLTKLFSGTVDPSNPPISNTQKVQFPL